MKQLKFMLAAATAIGLATAAQATDYNSTNFESDDLGDFPGRNSTWVAEDAGDNTSRIVADASMLDLASTKYTEQYGSDTAHTKSLKVETGTKPILRYLKETQGGYESVSDVYIDTMVQFTVTPEGEEPVPGPDDKLMLYAQKVGEGDSAKTNLFVVTANVAWNEEEGQDSYPTNWYNTKVEVSTDETWYRLTVKASAVEVAAEALDGTKQINLFEIYLDGTQIEAEEFLVNAPGISSEDGKKYFPSIQGATATAGIKAVGFAGEGKVDDLALTDNDPFTPDSTDFTFVVTWDTGISAVAYTIGSTTTQVPENGTFKVPQDATVELSVTLFDSEWTKLADGTVLKFEDVAADKKDINLTTVKIAQKTDDEGNVVVNPDASASDVGINSDSAFAGADAEKLGEVLTWAKNASVTVDQINKMTFSTAGDPAGATDADKLVEEAYLLNCTTAEVENKKKSFKISADDLTKLLKEGTLTELDVDSNLYNGKVVIEGRNDLSEGTWEITKQGNSHKFYRARLVFPSAVAE